MDWNVQVMLPSGQIKTVQVYDYNLQTDAEFAALSQTGADRVIYSSCFMRANHTNNNYQLQRNYSHPIFYDDEDEDEDEVFEEYLFEHKPIARNSSSKSDNEILAIIFSIIFLFWMLFVYPIFTLIVLSIVGSFLINKKLKK